MNKSNQIHPVDVLLSINKYEYTSTEDLLEALMAVSELFKKGGKQSLSNLIQEIAEKSIQNDR